MEILKALKNFLVQGLSQKQYADSTGFKKYLLLCKIKFTALQYNPLLDVNMHANDLEDFGFHSGVFHY